MSEPNSIGWSRRSPLRAMPARNDLTGRSPGRPGLPRPKLLRLRSPLGRPPHSQPLRPVAPSRPGPLNQARPQGGQWMVSSVAPLPAIRSARKVPTRSRVGRWSAGAARGASSHLPLFRLRCGGRGRAAGASCPRQSWSSGTSSTLPRRAGTLTLTRCLGDTCAATPPADFGAGASLPAGSLRQRSLGARSSPARGGAHPRRLVRAPCWSSRLPNRTAATGRHPKTTTGSPPQRLASRSLAECSLLLGRLAGSSPGSRQWHLRGWAPPPDSGWLAMPACACPRRARGRPRGTAAGGRVLAGERPGRRAS